MTRQHRDGAKPEFRARTDPDGLRVVDHVERAQFDLYTRGPVDPVPVSTSAFCFPVDGAVSVDAAEIEVPLRSDLYVRDRSGSPVGSSASPEPAAFPRDAYNVEVTGADVKLYLAVESALTLRESSDSMVVEVADPPVAVGARSFHENPAGTVTTTENIRDVMAAVSLLGSALKTLSPERSFPTLRGHPPLVEVGEELSVPDGIVPPDTGVTIEVPATYDRVFEASTLAYYLGAEVVPGAEPRLVADGFERPLTAPDGFAREASRVLRQLFLLDCVTRTEGYYRVDLAERRAVEAAVDLDFADLYDRPLAEQVAAYLRVPFEAVEAHLPTWKLTTDVLPVPSNVEMLPFTASDLAVVRCPGSPTWTTIQPEPEELAEFYRETGPAFTRGRADGGPLDVVRPEPADSLEHAWVGDGFPVGASKATVGACRRRLDREERDPGSIAIDVVCNDPRMDDERTVSEAYGPRELVTFDVSVHCGLTTEEFGALLSGPTDFLHYVGHVREEGVQCADGYLDVRGLDAVGVDAFLLNACRSYEQGEALVERGSIGGIVTLSNLGNAAAISMGRALARLLNLGFPLAGALAVARDQSYAGNQYIVVGDGNVELAQSRGGMPTAVSVERLGEDLFDVSLWKYPTTRYGLGSFATPKVGDDAVRHLSGGSYGPETVSSETLDDLLDTQVVPVRSGDDLHWSDRVRAEDL